MLFVWAKGLSKPVAYKCHDLPRDGHGKPAAYLAKHELKPEEEGMLIRELEVKYPAPKLTDQLP
jgi:hypothetical protein